MTTIQAEFEMIRPSLNPFHATDNARVQAIIDAVTSEKDKFGPTEVDWTMPPVLVLDNDGTGYSPFDGHHRLMAASVLNADYGILDEIPAWVVSQADFDRLVEAEFDGDCPSRLCDLREYIMCGDTDGDSICEHDYIED